MEQNFFKRIRKVTTETPWDILKKYTGKPFNLNWFPKLVQAVIRHISELRKLPIEMPAFCALGMLSGTAGDKFICTKAVNGYKQLPNLFILGVGEASSGKSAALEPLRRCFYKDGNNLTYIENSTSTELVVYDPIFAEFIGKLYDEMNNNYNVELSSDFMFENGTVESIIKIMYETMQPLFSINTEGREILDVVTGRYGKKSNSDDTSIFCKAWSHEPIDSMRVNRRIKINNPSLSVLWLVQPCIAREYFTNSKTFVENGFASRFLYFKASAPLPLDDEQEIEENAGIFNTWEKLMIRIYAARESDHINIICATPEAKAIFDKQHKFWENARRGELNKFSSLLGRAREQAVRVALVFAIADHSNEITADIAQNACDLVDYSYSCALEIFAESFVEKFEKDKDAAISFFEKRKSNKETYSTVRNFLHLEPSDIDMVVNFYPDSFRKIKGSKKGYLLEYTKN